MPGEGIILDPVSEDPANVQLDLVDNVSYALLSHAYPPPPRDSIFVSSADTEGEAPVQHRYRNREISVTLRVTGASQSDILTRLGYLEQKAAKVNREGGTLKRTLPSGDTIVFDLLGGEGDPKFDRRFINLLRSEVSLKFQAKPFGRGPEVALASHTESILPVLVFNEVAIKGDVPATARLVITEGGGKDQWWVVWGVQSRYYDPAASAGLFFEAEGRTLLGSGSTSAGDATYSPRAGNNRVSAMATPNNQWQAILSTQAPGGGAHLSHVGDFQVFARVLADVDVRLSWSVGDFRSFTSNAPTTVSSAGGPRLVDLGQVHIPKVASGTQRWQGRIEIRSPNAYGMYIDYFFLAPVSEGSGRASAVQQFEAPVVFIARDEFNQTAGALAGKTLPVGGTWASNGPGTNDFTVDTTRKKATRTNVIGGGSDRYATAGTTPYASVYVQADIGITAAWSTFDWAGVLARYVSQTSYLQAVFDTSTNSVPSLVVSKNVVGSFVELYRSPPLLVNPIVNDVSIRLLVDAAGHWFVWVFNAGSEPGAPLTSGQDQNLATGGTLAAGLPGITDRATQGNATRTYDNFLVGTPTPDAALFASRQLEVRSDRANRQDAAGTTWTPPSKYEGDYIKIPPAGREGRSTRVIVKATRNDPVTMGDPGFDPITAQLFYTPRYLVVPSP